MRTTENVGAGRSGGHEISTGEQNTRLAQSCAVEVDGNHLFHQGKVLGMPDAEEPFAAALLQDMAVPLLAQHVPEAYCKLFTARADSDAKVRLSRLEEHVFGWNHAEAAGIVARRWNMPEAFATLIEDHLDVERWAAHADSEPARLAVSLSALLPTTGDTNWAEHKLFEKYFQQVKPKFGPALEIEDLLEQTDREYADFAPVLQMNIPKETLVDWVKKSSSACPTGSVLSLEKSPT